MQNKTRPLQSCFFSLRSQQIFSWSQNQYQFLKPQFRPFIRFHTAFHYRSRFIRFMEEQSFQPYVIILNLTYHNKIIYHTLLYSSLFSTFYLTGSGKLDVAYVAQVKALPCVSQNIQKFFVATDWVIFFFLNLYGFLQYLEDICNTTVFIWMIVSKSTLYYMYSSCHMPLTDIFSWIFFSFFF